MIKTIIFKLAYSPTASGMLATIFEIGGVGGSAGIGYVIDK